MRKILTRRFAFIILGGLLGAGVLFLAIWSMVAGPVTVYRIISSGDSTIYDFKRFPGRSLHASPAPFQFKAGLQADAVPQVIHLEGRGDVKLDDLLESSNTIAFLVIKDDGLLDERYFKGHSASDMSQAFSTSKSILSILIGTAIDDGLIKSVKDPVTDYVPELAAAGFGKVTLENLLNMQSNMNYVENDDMFGRHVIFNYTNHLESEILKLDLLQNPDQQFRYKSGDNALLGLILQRALRDKTITQYAQERLWTPLGMQDEGFWAVDREGGLERTWCCLSASARDLAKLGRLYLRNGDWNGTQIVSSEWVKQSTSAGVYTTDTWPSGYKDLGASNYKYHWWLLSEKDGDYSTWGKDGQYIYANSEKNLIIVRLGETDGNISWFKVFQELAGNIQ